MPSPRHIQPTDTLETGFRAAHNQTVDAIADASNVRLTSDGVLQFYNVGGVFLGEVNLSAVVKLKNESESGSAQPTPFQSASEADEGLTKYATPDEAVEGLENYKSVTPAALSYVLDNFGVPKFLLNESADGQFLILHKDRFGNITVTTTTQVPGSGGLYVPLSPTDLATLIGQTAPWFIKDPDGPVIPTNPNSTPPFVPLDGLKALFTLNQVLSAGAVSDGIPKIGGVVYDQQVPILNSPDVVLTGYQADADNLNTTKTPVWNLARYFHQLYISAQVKLEAVVYTFKSIVNGGLDADALKTLEQALGVYRKRQSLDDTLAAGANSAGAMKIGGIGRLNGFNRYDSPDAVLVPTGDNFIEVDSFDRMLVARLNAIVKPYIESLGIRPTVAAQRTLLSIGIVDAAGDQVDEGGAINLTLNGYYSDAPGAPVLIDGTISLPAPAPAGVNLTRTGPGQFALSVATNAVIGDTRAILLTGGFETKTAAKSITIHDATALPTPVNVVNFVSARYDKTLAVWIVEGNASNGLMNFSVIRKATGETVFSGQGARYDGNDANGSYARSLSNVLPAGDYTVIGAPAATPGDQALWKRADFAIQPAIAPNSCSAIYEPQTGKLSITGRLNNASRVNLLIIRDSQIAATIADVVAPDFSASYTPTVSGMYEVKAQEVNKDSNYVSSGPFQLTLGSTTPNPPNPPQQQTTYYPSSSPGFVSVTTNPTPNIVSIQTRRTPGQVNNNGIQVRVQIVQQAGSVAPKFAFGKVNYPAQSAATEVPTFQDGSYQYGTIISDLPNTGPEYIIVGPLSSAGNYAKILIADKSGTDSDWVTQFSNAI